MPDLPSPPVPPTLDVRCFATMPLDVLRLLSSDTWLRAADNPAVGYVAITLWARSWHQVPAGSLPDADSLLARLALVSEETWRSVRDDALRGFVKCSDGRLYHPVVCQYAVEAEDRKHHQTKNRERKREAMREWRSRSRHVDNHVVDTFPQRGKGREGNRVDKKDSAASAARGASESKSAARADLLHKCTRSPGIASSTKYARRLDGGFETETGEYVSFEEAFWAEKDLAANRDIGGSMMGALLAAQNGNAGAAYDALLLALKKSEPRRYVAGVIRKRETEAHHAKAAANGTAKALPGDPKTIPQWVLDARGEGETVKWNAKAKYWERGGRGWDNDENEIAF